MANVDSDIKKITKLISLMKDNELIEIEIAHGEDKICLKRQDPNAGMTAVPMMPPAGMMAPPSAPAAAEAAADTQEYPVITSPIVGTFYEAPNPDSAPFVEVGAHVSPSSVVCIIEAMKVMNEIKAEASGTILEILVENGAAIEYGQPLFKIQPDA